jgi:uncharacterized protein YwlG (UPF0340 family)
MPTIQAAFDALHARLRDIQDPVERERVCFFAGVDFMFTVIGMMAHKDIPEDLSHAAIDSISSELRLMFDTSGDDGKVQ